MLKIVHSNNIVNPPHTNTLVHCNTSWATSKVKKITSYAGGLYPHQKRKRCLPLVYDSCDDLPWLTQLFILFLAFSYCPFWLCPLFEAMLVGLFKASTCSACSVLIMKPRWHTHCTWNQPRPYRECNAMYISHVLVRKITGPAWSEKWYIQNTP